MVDKIKNNNWQKFYYEKADGNYNLDKTIGKKIDRAISFMNENLFPGSRILEVGCGVAGLVSRLSSDVIYYGMDNSEYAIRKAQDQWKDKKNVNFFISSVDDLNFEKEYFDIIIAHYVLEHLDNPKEFLLRSVKLLKPGGYLILVAPNLEFPFAYPSALRHKSFFYRLYYYLVRLYDFFTRLLGIYNFRTIEDNYLNVTGKYQLIDDDLVYLASTYEVVHLLQRNNLNIIEADRLQNKKGLKNMVKYILTFFPGLRYFGTEMFLICKKYE